MKQFFTSVTRKGQVTLPVEIRRLLGIRAGDKVALSLITEAESGEPQVIVKPVRSVAEMTFGAVPPRKRPEDFRELRHHVEEGMAQDIMAEMNR
ncbi:MAG TPA: AbrB/MazE/SpoVT family DNA-binding domain-containing protein [Chloroflexia bacterium]